MLRGGKKKAEISKEKGGKNQIVKTNWFIQWSRKNFRDDCWPSRKVHNKIMCIARRRCSNRQQPGSNWFVTVKVNKRSAKANQRFQRNDRLLILKKKEKNNEWKKRWSKSNKEKRIWEKKTKKKTWIQSTHRTAGAVAGGRRS